MKSRAIFAIWIHSLAVAAAARGVPYFCVASCNKATSDDPPAARSATLPVPERGERVVIEPAAAEFFEARVLEMQGDRVRVQMSGRGDTKVVALSDVYRLIGVSRIRARGDFIICKLDAAWAACRVESNDERISVASAEGTKALIASQDAITPSAVTELNIRRRFERAHERAEFERGLLRAGSPVAPPGWKPAPAERVIARLESGWFSGAIHELGKKELRVAWAGSDRISDVALIDLVPAPPYPGPFHKGDFVLVRPLAPSGAWQPMRIESTSESEIVIRDAAGNKRSAAPGDLVPLAGRPDSGN